MITTMTVDSGTDLHLSEPTLWVWQGQAAYLGASLRLDTHSTPVQCFVLGVDESITVRTAAGERRRRSVLIPARTSHKLECEGRVLFHYLDPRSAAGARVRAAMGEPAAPVAARHRNEAELTAYLNQPGSADPRELRRLIVGPETPATIDRRIRAVMNAIVDDPAGRAGAAELARDLGLSTSRFLHLFSADAGTSFRRYRVWARLLSVAGAVAAGTDLTRAAADAGFASASHFSDTFRTLFGLTASELLAQNTRIVVVADTPDSLRR